MYCNSSFNNRNSASRVLAARSVHRVSGRRAPGGGDRRRPPRRGMTLLEVILSIAILGGCLAVLGELARIGTRAAKASQVLSTAQMLCDSIAAEITAGMTAPETTQGVVDDYGGMQWSYFVQVDQAAQEGMLAVMVTVQQATDASLRPVSFSLVRWMIDPQLEADVEAAASEAAAASSSSSGSTDSSASGTSTSSGSSGTPSGTSSGAQGGGR